MALITCPECGHEVSDTAETCPNCGYKLKNPTDLNFDLTTQVRLDKTVKESFYTRLIGLAIVFVGSLVALFINVYRYQNILQILLPIFMMAVSIAAFVYVYRKFNPRTHTKQEMFNTAVRNGRIALIVIGVILILAGIAFTIICWDIMTNPPEYADPELLPLLIIYIGIYYLAGIACLIYYFIKKKHDF